MSLTRPCKGFSAETLCHIWFFWAHSLSAQHWADSPGSGVFEHPRPMWLFCRNPRISALGEIPTQDAQCRNPLCSNLVSHWLAPPVTWKPLTSTLGQFSTHLGSNVEIFIYSFTCLFFLDSSALSCQSPTLRVPTRVEHTNLNGAKTTEAQASLLWANRIASKMGPILQGGPLTHLLTLFLTQQTQGALKKESWIMQLPDVVLQMYFPLMLWIYL